MVLGAVVGLVVIAVVAMWPAPQPPEFVSAEHRFRVRFGGTPEVTTHKRPDSRTTLYAFRGDEGERAVAVTEVPVPDDVTQESESLYLRTARDDMVGAVGGELVSDAPVTIAGKYQGRTFTARIQGPRPGLLRAHIYLAGKRLYQVTVKGTEEYANAPAATAFLDSFAVTSDQ
jgi:hypothetical protein